MVVHTAYLGIGSNQGDRLAHLQSAVDRLAEKGGDVTAVSPVYETEAHTLDPDAEQPAFLNAVVEGAVSCAPEHLLDVAQAIERAEGRDREGEQRWAPRPLDVDLLCVGSMTRRTDRLTLPHPRLAERRFVLRPWADIAPDAPVPPPFGASVRELLDACSDAASVRRVEHELRQPRSGA